MPSRPQHSHTRVKAIIAAFCFFLCALSEQWGMVDAQCGSRWRGGILDSFPLAVRSVTTFVLFFVFLNYFSYRRDNHLFSYLFSYFLILISFSSSYAFLVFLLSIAGFDNTGRIVGTRIVGAALPSSALYSGFASSWVVLANAAATTTAPPPPPSCVPPDACEEIVFGQSAALSGPSQLLGRRMRAGVRAAFQQVNTAALANGGVSGLNSQQPRPRTLRLISYDDGYDPEPCYNNTMRLVHNDSVFALVGYVGTPTSAAATPIAIAESVPFIGAFTGTDALRTPFSPNLLNIRASYNDEMAAQALLLVDRLNVKRIACFYQDDAFGLAGYNGIVRALAAMGMSLVATGIYARNTVAVEAGLEAIITGVSSGSGGPSHPSSSHPPSPLLPPRPQAVVMVGTYAPLAKFVQLAKADPRVDADCVFTTLSFVGSEPFRDALVATDATGGGGGGGGGGGASSTSASSTSHYHYWQNVYISEVVPLPSSTEYHIVQNYLAAMRDLSDDDDGGSGASDNATAGDTISFEGYVVGRFVASVLSRMRTVSRGAFLETIYSTKMAQLDDLLLGPYSGACYGQLATICGCSQGMKQVWMAEINHTAPSSAGTVPPATASPVGAAAAAAAGDGALVHVPDFRFTFPLTQCQSVASVVKAPAVFLQLLPSADGPARSVGLQRAAGIRLAFAAANAAGGFAGGRRLVLLTRYYAAAEEEGGGGGGGFADLLAAMLDKYPVVGLLGCVDIPPLDLTTVGELPSIGAFESRVPVTVASRTAAVSSLSSPSSSAADLAIATDATLDGELMALVGAVHAAAQSDGCCEEAASGSGSRTVHLLCYASDCDGLVLAALRKSLVSFGLTLGTRLSLSNSRSSASAASRAEHDTFLATAKGYVLAIGFDNTNEDSRHAENRALLAAWLSAAEANPSLSLMLTSRTVVPLHDQLSSSLFLTANTTAAKALRKRVLFASSLPFVDSSSALTLQYVAAAAAESIRTNSSSSSSSSGEDGGKGLLFAAPLANPPPAALQGYVDGAAVHDVLSRSGNGAQTSPAAMVAAWYSTRLITLSQDVQLGSYQRCEGDGADAQQGKECGCNSGVRRVCVYSAASFGGSSSSSSALPVYCHDYGGCSVQYTTPIDHRDDALSKGAIAGIVVGCCAAAIASIALYIFFGRSDARDNRNAPRDASKPFCIVFTDIQSSTALWATVPSQMADALEAHHALIRGLIAQYKGYEVKTSGDSFMIAFHDVEAAVRLALDIQTTFYGHNWSDHSSFGIRSRSNVIDDSYVEFIEDARYLSDTPDLFPPALPKDRHDQLWNGLRVRVGVHYGMGEVRFDEVSKGYDYYGTVVNAASRIEAVAHGGQIAISAAVYDRLAALSVGGLAVSRAPPTRSTAAVSDLNTTNPNPSPSSLLGALREGTATFSPLGAVPLRGLSEPLVLYQVLPKALDGRMFPPLRLDHVAGDDQNSGNGDGSDDGDDDDESWDWEGFGSGRNGHNTPATAATPVATACLGTSRMLSMTMDDRRHLNLLHHHQQNKPLYSPLETGGGGPAFHHGSADYHHHRGYAEVQQPLDVVKEVRSTTPTSIIIIDDHSGGVDGDGDGEVGSGVRRIDSGSFVKTPRANGGGGESLDAAAVGSTASVVATKSGGVTMLATGVGVAAGAAVRVTSNTNNRSHCSAAGGTMRSGGGAPAVGSQQPASSISSSLVALERRFEKAANARFGHHPLVLAKAATARELYDRYYGSMLVLKALVGACTAKQKEATLRALCDRLKVPLGSTKASGAGARADGGGGVFLSLTPKRVDRVLHNLVNRVLPATFQQQRRHRAAAAQGGGEEETVADFAGSLLKVPQQQQRNHSLSQNSRDMHTVHTVNNDAAAAAFDVITPRADSGW